MRGEYVHFQPNIKDTENNQDDCTVNRMTVNTILKELRRDGYIVSSKKQKYVLTELGIETVEKAKDIK